MRPPLFISKARILAVIALPLFWSVDPARAASVLESMDNEVSSLYDNVKDAVVKVHAERPLAYDTPEVGPSHCVGSGFFLDGEGRLITAGTLVEGAEKCYIDWHGRRVEAKVISHDPVTRLALLKVDPAQCVGPGVTLPSLTFGNSDDLRVGSMVVAVGYPYELPSAPVVGFVTGFDISCGKRVFPLSFIRAGCRLSPGQGGSPLLNIRGQVVGVVLAARGDDHCYALPGNAAKKVCADIIAHGEAQHGWVGLDITQRQLTNSLNASPEWQVYIREVFSNTPAAEAGFQDQDVLVRIYTNEIHHTADVLNTMFYRHAGESVKMAVVRAGTTQELTIVVGKRQPQVEQSIAQETPFPAPRYPTSNFSPAIVPTAVNP